MEKKKLKQRNACERSQPVFEESSEGTPLGFGRAEKRYMLKGIESKETKRGSGRTGTSREAGCVGWGKTGKKHETFPWQKGWWPVARS